MGTPTLREVRTRARRTLKAPIIMFVVALVLVVALLVLWNVVLALDYQRIKVLAERATAEGGGAFHWTFIAIGSGLFVVTISLVSVIGATLIQEIRFNQRLSGFIATFTHELNSPLASIKLFAQTLTRPELPERERARFLDLILANIERLRGQIANVLVAAQIDGPRGVTLATEPLGLRDYLEDYLATRRAGFEFRDGKVELELAAGPEASCAIDPDVFRQVLDNIVDNALKYASAEGAQVTVAIEPAGPKRIAVEVTDRGCGIDAKDLEQIFERFGRARENPEAARRRGTGLGLWIARALVKAHDGEITARSPGVGQGATFRIELPAWDDDLAENEEAASAAGRAHDATATPLAPAPAPAPPGPEPVP